jgi:hypothetical protein
MANQYTVKYNKGFWTDEKLAKLKELRESGLSFGKIGHEFGATTNMVLSAWYRKIEKRKFKSDYLTKEQAAVPLEERNKPTLAWVPGLTETKAYRLEVFRDRMG